MCGTQRHGEPEKSFDLHGLADKAIEGLASDVLDNQHRPPALAHEFHRPQRPVGSEGIPEFVFAGQTSEALERRVLRARQDGDERVRYRPQDHRVRVCKTHVRPLARAPLQTRVPNQPRTMRMPASVRPSCARSLKTRRRMSSVSGTASRAAAGG